MDDPFPSSTDPLLMTPSTSESHLTSNQNNENGEDNENAENEGQSQQFQQKQANLGGKKRAVPAFTVSPQDSPQGPGPPPPMQKQHGIQFRIGDTGTPDTDNLDILQELLTSHGQPSPTIVTPPNEGRIPPQRMNSASSIHSMSSAGSSEHHSQSRIINIPQKCADEPKQVLVELYDLKLEDERDVAGCWEETARWIKYEEDVEGVDHRWGLPHVSFLSFHALLQLRKCIAKGIVLLDMPNVPDFLTLTELIAAAIASECHEEFGAHNARRIAQILQLRHLHVGGRRMSRISTTASNLLHLLEGRAAAGNIGMLHERERAHTTEPPHRSISAAPLSGHPSAVNMRKILATELTSEARPHGRSFAHSPPTIAEVDECQDSANNSIHKGWLQPRNSTPNVRLTYNSTNTDGGTVSLRENIKSSAKTLAERKLTEWTRRSGRKRDEETGLDTPRNHHPNQQLMPTHKCSTEVNFHAHIHGELKKLPDGTELVQVMVGEIKWLKKARFVMLRLANAVPLPELADSHFPVRIIFVILGPSLADGSYHELGRSLATLMANKHFKSIAYGARDRCQLIEGLDSFLDGSVVIPPGEVLLLPIGRLPLCTGPWTCGHTTRHFALSLPMPDCARLVDTPANILHCFCPCAIVLDLWTRRPTCKCHQCAMANQGADFKEISSFMRFFCTRRTSSQLWSNVGVGPANPVCAQIAASSLAHYNKRSTTNVYASHPFYNWANGSTHSGGIQHWRQCFNDGATQLVHCWEIDSKRLISGDELKKALRRRKKEMNKHKVAASEKDAMEKQKVDDNNNNGTSPAGPSCTHLQLTTNGRTTATNGKNHGGPKEVIVANGGGQQPRKPVASGNGTEDAKRPEKWHWECPLFRGLRADITRRIPLYCSDIRDAANFQCLTSVVFMFFASFVPAISFGGLMGKYTDERMGTIETLFAQCICGILWGLFSAQPLLIMSATGPVLIFEASLYTFCETLHLDFLTIRFYAGLFIFMIALCISALDGARLLVFVTRFTEDIFATLISAIFIAESLHFVWHTFKENPVEDYNFYERIHSNCRHAENASTTVQQIANVLNAPTAFAPLPFDIEQLSNTTRNLTAQIEAHHRLTNALAEFKDPSISHRLACGEAEPNTALLTAIIVFSTFILAFMLKKLRESFYLGKHLRRAIGDFGVLIAITLVALIVHWCIPDPYLARLDMPDHLNFTNMEKRGHGLLVRPKLGLGDWHGIFVALIAALLVFILLFVETEITELLLTRKERGCKKGSGMHWDLVLMGACAFLCSCFGLPWMCAAAVQSLAHCSSLTVMKKTAPGARPEVDHVIEQRCTTIGVSILIGLIAFGGSYLRLPLASLFGVFLYLGVMNLCGVQLVQRVVLFFIPEKYFPDTPYTQEMSIWRMHLYTWIQLICLFLVYTVKYFKKTALAFPFVLMLFIFFRQIILPRVFTPAELKAIDGDEHGAEEDEEWRSDKDFYYDNAGPIPI